MALLFVFVLDYTKGLMESRFFQKYAKIGLEEPVTDYFFFYSSVPDYHHDEPLISIDHEGIEIRFYEILTASVTESGLETDEFVYVIVYGKDAPIPENAVLQLTGETELIMTLARFRTLDLYLGVMETGSAYMPKSLLADPNFHHISVSTESDGALFLEPYELSGDSFVLQDAVIDYYEANQSLPTLELEAEGIYPYIRHVGDEFQYIFWIGIGLYTIILIGATIWIFFRKKRFLGKNPPSSLLKKEIEETPR